MREIIEEIIKENYSIFNGSNEAELNSSILIEELFKEKSIDFLKYVIDNYNIEGIDSFGIINSDTIITADKVFEDFIKIS